MKKIIAAFLFVLFIFLLFQRVDAHVLKADKTIGAVMHIEPADDPIVGAESTFIFEFKDKTGKFNPSNCDCTFSIFEGEKQLFTQPLFQSNADPSLTSASVVYTFPKRNVYEVIVTGKPQTGASFEAFRLSYTIRVERVQEETDHSSPSFTPFIASGVVVLVLTIFFIKLYFRNKKVTG